MNGKKIAALFLALLLLTSLFAGCNMRRDLKKKNAAPDETAESRETASLPAETEGPARTEPTETEGPGGTSAPPVTVPDPDPRDLDIDSDSFTPPKRVILLHDEVMIRSGAGTGNGAVGKSKIGDLYTYLGETRDGSGVTWYKVKTDKGVTGYVISTYSRIYDADRSAAYEAYMNQSLANAFQHSLVKKVWTAVSLSSNGGTLKKESLRFYEDGRVEAEDYFWDQIWTYPANSGMVADSKGWVDPARGFPIYYGTYQVAANRLDPGSCTVTVTLTGTNVGGSHNETFSLRFNEKVLTGAFLNQDRNNHAFHPDPGSSTPDALYQAYKKNGWLTNHSF